MLNYNEKGTLNIWACGNNNFPEKIPISNVIKYNLSEVHELPNIDEYNKIFNEFVCWYYVWHNNLHSPIIGTAHYSRYPNSINISKVENGIIQYYFAEPRRVCKHLSMIRYKEFAFIENQIFEFSGPIMLLNDTIDYLNSQKIVNIYDIRKVTYFNNKEYKFAGRELFVCKWEIFCDMISFVYGFIQFIENKYNLHSMDDWKEHIIKHVINHYRENMNKIIGRYFAMCYQSVNNFIRILDDDYGYGSKCNCWRVYGYIIEMLISIYILTHDNYFDDKHKCLIEINAQT